jgi:hypothetical protein
MAGFAHYAIHSASPASKPSLRSETIQSHYPTLTLEQVNGANTLYQSHKEEVEQAMEERRRAEDADGGPPQPS